MKADIEPISGWTKEIFAEKLREGWKPRADGIPFHAALEHEWTGWKKFQQTMHNQGGASDV